MPGVTVHPDVRAALDAGRPVVALESAVITAGLPRAPIAASAELNIPGWRADQPCNLELARAVQRVVRERGAEPATIAVIDGTLHIGLADDELIRLAADRSAAKASITNLASLIGAQSCAGTTVSATLAACTLARSELGTRNSELPSPIPVFATGGIGGVHRNWQRVPDISADLRALAETPVAVVCSGGKSILDLPATLEALEAIGVPVVGYQTDWLPQFQCRGDEPANPIRLPLAQRVNDVPALVRLCLAHWNTLQRRSAILVANPVPQQFAMDPAELDRAVDAAERAAHEQSITGSDRTPFLLREIAARTGQRSLLANLALLVSNARLAAELAVELAAARAR